MSSPSPELNHDKIISAKVVRAGAGAGKTTGLIAEVHRFYTVFKKTHGREPRIVLTTFTRKATQELRERLMLEAQKKNDYEFLNFVLSKNNLLISTIHGVLQLFLRQFAQTIDLDPGFQLTDDVFMRRQSKIILRDLLNERTQVLLDELNIEELCTLLMEYQEATLLLGQINSYGIDDFKIARDKMLSDFSDLAQSLGDEILNQSDKANWIEYGEMLKNVSAQLKTDYTKALDLLSLRKPPGNKKNPPVTQELDDAVKDLKANLQDQLDPASLNENEWQLFITFFKEFESLAKEFSARLIDWKKKNGRITISDLELMSLEAIQKAQSQIAFFSENFDYWLIDEFQDTSPLQIQLLEKFITDRPYFVVGDPQQSIYFFRGAREQVFEDMQKKIIDNKGEFQLLNTNYRSHKNTMSFINYFFGVYAKKFTQMELGGKNTTEGDVAEICLASSEPDQEQAILKHIRDLNLKNVALNEICVLSRNNTDLKKIATALEAEKIPYILHAAGGFQNRREILDALNMLKFLVNPHDNLNLIELLRSPWFRVQDENIISITEQRQESFWQKFLEVRNEKAFEAILRLKNYILDAFENGITQTFENMLVESAMVDLSYHLDRSGRRESNIWKLLTQLKSEDHEFDFNYMDFIKSNSKNLVLDEGTADSDAVSSLEPNCVQLMTIHMSKGLEFDHVIIPFIDKSPRTTTFLKFLLDIDQKKWGMSLKFDEEKNLVPLPAKNILLHMQTEEAKENDRLLYVAMTRAKKTIFMSTSGARSKKNSWFEKMPELSPGHFEMDGFSYNVSAGPWESQKMEFENRKSESVIAPLFDLEEIRVAQPKKNVTQNMEPTNPNFSYNTLKKALYGTQAHRVFEALKYGRKITDDQVLVDAQNYILNLKEIPITEILKNGYAEWGYVLNNLNQTTSGQIDLWGIVNGTLWVIDYKTGRSSDKDKAFLQLQEYAKAIQAYEPVQAINLVALYPLEKTFFVQTV